VYFSFLAVTTSISQRKKQSEGRAALFVVGCMRLLSAALVHDFVDIRKILLVFIPFDESHNI